MKTVAGYIECDQGQGWEDRGGVETSEEDWLFPSSQVLHSRAPTSVTFSPRKLLLTASFYLDLITKTLCLGFTLILIKSCCICFNIFHISILHMFKNISYFNIAYVSKYFHAHLMETLHIMQKLQEYKLLLHDK